MRLAPRSAAYRIALSFAAIFALSTVLIGMIVLLAVHAAFQRQLDESIRQTTSSLLSEFDDGDRGELGEAIAIREKSTSSALGFAVFTPDGQRLTGALDTSMPPVGWHRIVFRDPLEGPDPARALVTLLPDGNRLVVAADLEPVEQMDETILTVFALGAAGIALLGGFLAWLLGRYLQRRLDGIGKGARAFATGDYAGRADVGPSGDEFDQLAVALNAMLDRIEALLRNLRQVTSDLAHDMRTPLTHLRGELESLLGAPAAEKDQRTEAAIEKCDDILRLFGAILRISELEGGELRKHFRPVDLALLVSELVEAHEPLAEESDHRLTTLVGQTSLMVVGDRELLAQALINLVENAFNHTPHGSAVTIGVDLEKGRPALFVRDTGPGISAADRSRATERFVRLDAARSTPGHGLGLSLVKAVAEAHGAEFELRDAGPGLDVRIIFAEMEA